MHSFLLPLRSVFLVSVDSSLLFRVDAVNGVESVIFSPADLRTKVILGGSAWQGGKLSKIYSGLVR